MPRLLSHFWPIRVERVEGKHGPLEIMWEYGRLVLNSARANQSFGGLHHVWQRSFAAVGLKERRIGRVLLLGLGAGSVVHILRRELGIMAPIVAVDDDPVMVQIAREHFSLGHHAGVEVVIDDAFDALQRITGPFDLIVVDLFTEMDVPVHPRRTCDRCTPWCATQPPRAADDQHHSP